MVVMVLLMMAGDNSVLGRSGGVSNIQKEVLVMPTVMVMMVVMLSVLVMMTVATL